ncbi:hypothetical protein K3X23_14690, partial [Listeria monocytogenes]|nr:hypothetical protein [Listeria monocytogenes]
MITTAGKIIFNSVLPEDYRYINDSYKNFLSEEDILDTTENYREIIQIKPEKNPFSKHVIQTVIEEVYEQYP